MTQVTTRFKQKPRGKKPNRASQRYGMSPEHLKLIRQLPSCISGGSPCDPHHLRFGKAGKERGIGLKATDKWAIPLTRSEHIGVHKVGSKMEAIYFENLGVHAERLAKELWNATGDLDQMVSIVKAHREDRT